MNKKQKLWIKKLSTINMAYIYIHMSVDNLIDISLRPKMLFKNVIWLNQILNWLFGWTDKYKQYLVKQYYKTDLGNNTKR